MNNEDKQICKSDKEKKAFSIFRNNFASLNMCFGSNGKMITAWNFLSRYLC